MEQTIIFIIIILVASILQTSTGFGFSIMATPFLLMLFTPREAIQINIILSLVISVALIWKIRRDIDSKLLKRIIAGSVLGIPFGVFIFAVLNIIMFKLSIGLLLLFLTAFLIFNIKINPTKARDYSVGGISGLLTTSIGMPGPPLLLYFAGTQTSKEKVRATTLAFYLFIYFISLISQVLVMGTNNLIWQSSFYAIPIVFLGLFIGQVIFKWINQKVFSIITYILLIFTGIFLLYQSIASF